MAAISHRWWSAVSKTFPGRVRRTADPSATLPRISCGSWWRCRTSCAFPLQKGAHAALSGEARQEIRVGMTKGMAAVALKQLLSKRLLSSNHFPWKCRRSLCHPERSRGICGFLFGSNKCGPVGSVGRDNSKFLSAFREDPPLPGSKQSWLLRRELLSSRPVFFQHD